MKKLYAIIPFVLTGCGIAYPDLQPTRLPGHPGTCHIAWVGSTDERGLIEYLTDCGLTYYGTDCWNPGDTLPNSLLNIRAEFLKTTQTTF